MVTVKGYTFPAFDMKQGSVRKAQQLRNTIIQNLKRIGVHEDYVKIKEEAFFIKRTPASVSWYMDDQHLYFSYTPLSYMENLSIVSQVITHEVEEVLSGRKTREDCVAAFSEDRDVEVKRKEARTVLGLPHDTFDVELINKTYKDLSKKHHPDMGGDLEVFQQINIAHKTLKKELVA